MGGCEPIEQRVAGRKKRKKVPPFSLRLNKGERAALELAAAGVPLGTYIKSRLLDGTSAPYRSRGRFPVKDHQALSKLLAALGKSGVSSNLNQIADAIGSGSLPINHETDAAIQEACAHVTHMRALLLKALCPREEDGDDPEG